MKENWITEVDYFSELTDKQKMKVQFMFVNFGDRGSSSVESAALGGYAHLTQFMGTDNFNALKYCYDNYYSNIAGYSVFATEHSTTTSYGRDGEEDFVYEKLLENPDAPIMSFVADSYDVYAFTDMCTKPDGKIRKLLESRPHQKLVLRPDSGDPIEVIGKMLDIMVDNIVEKNPNMLEIHFKQYDILWGDGLTPTTIEKILKIFTREGYSAENFVFGSGGDLMQNHTRDTQKFAIKCSSITVIDIDDCGPYKEDIDVFKDPITDPGKVSKKGKVTTYYSKEKDIYFVDKVGIDFSEKYSDAYEVLEVVYENGKLIKEYSLDEIRERSR